ncbi:MAG: carbohydrate-binding family 9-like protein [Victivallaceae bacterium]|nr:carbohydrate-binding family 9-like protein [Victivallaceae bacterium]
MPRYTIRKSLIPLTPGAAPDAPQWAYAVELPITTPNGNGTDHLPDTRVKMLYDDNGIAGIFTNRDRYVIGKTTADQQMVCLDSCDEFFVQPAGDEKYYNFEMSCNGHMLLYHIRSMQKKQYEVMPQAELDKIVRHTLLPERVFPEVAGPLFWYLSFYIPLDFFVRNSKIKLPLAGQTWHGNFTKCADASSHYHWLTWIDLKTTDFHAPEEFGELYFGEEK